MRTSVTRARCCDPRSLTNRWLVSLALAPLQRSRLQYFEWSHSSIDRSYWWPQRAVRQPCITKACNSLTDRSLDRRSNTQESQQQRAELHHAIVARVALEPPTTVRTNQPSNQASQSTDRGRSLQPRDLHVNRLVGTMPDWLGSLVTLKRLYVTIQHTFALSRPSMTLIAFSSQESQLQPISWSHSVIDRIAREPSVPVRERDTIP